MTGPGMPRKTTGVAGADTTGATSYGVELGIDVPGDGRVCAAEVAGLPDLSAALHLAEDCRGRTATWVLDHPGAESMDAGPQDLGRTIVGATLFAYNDAEGTIWENPLTEWELALAGGDGPVDGERTLPGAGA